jgi:hypothetical protein
MEALSGHDENNMLFVPGCNSGLLKSDGLPSVDSQRNSALSSRKTTR